MGVQLDGALKIGARCAESLLLGVDHTPEIQKPGFIGTAIELVRNREQGGVQIAGFDGPLNRDENSFQIGGLTLRQHQREEGVPPRRSYNTEHGPIIVHMADAEFG